MASQGLRGFLICLAVLFSCCEAALQCSAPDNGVSNVPNVDLTNSLIIPSHGSSLYIYPGGSSLSCSGAVTGVEYCYQAGFQAHATIFTLLALSRTSTTTFTVERQIRVPAPAGSCAVGATCCDSYTFTTNERFALSQNDFNLGVLTPPGGQQVVGFHSKHFVPAYLMPTPSNVAVNSVITVSTQSSMALRVLRLVADSTVTPTDVCDSVFYVPNIPASTSDPGSTFYDPTAANQLYIYPSASPSGCPGTATGVEYCYQAGSSSIFTVLVMSRVRSGSNDVFTVTRELPITATGGQCLEQICCNSYTFTTSQRFEIPQDDFNFGVIGGPLIAFHSSAQFQYSAPAYLITAPANFGLNSMISLSTFTQGAFAFRVMRFIFDPNPPPPPPTTTAPPPTTPPTTTPPPTTTAPPPTTPPTTTPPPTTTAPPPTTPPTTTPPPSTNPPGPIEETAPPPPATDPPITTTEASTTNTEAPMTTATEAPETTVEIIATFGTLEPPAQIAPDANVAPTVVGVLVGLLIGVALVILSVSLVVLLVRKNRENKNGAPDDMGNSSGNTAVNGQGQLDNVYSPNGQISPQ